MYRYRIVGAVGSIMVRIERYLDRFTFMTPKNKKINLAVGATLDTITCAETYQVLMRLARKAGDDVAQKVLDYMQVTSYPRTGYARYDTEGDPEGHYGPEGFISLYWVPDGDCVYDGALIYNYMYDNEGYRVARLAYNGDIYAITLTGEEYLYN